MPNSPCFPVPKFSVGDSVVEDYQPYLCNPEPDEVFSVLRCETLSEDKTEIHREVCYTLLSDQQRVVPESALMRRATAEGRRAYVEQFISKVEDSK